MLALRFIEVRFDSKEVTLVYPRLALRFIEVRYDLEEILLVLDL